MWVDDFEGQWPNIEDVDDDRLVLIRKMTVEAINDPILLIQQPFVWYLEDQLRRIDYEMRRRRAPRGAATFDQGAPLHTPEPVGPDESPGRPTHR